MNSVRANLARPPSLALADIQLEWASLPAAPFFCIAGIWRTHGEVGEAFTMLTTEPGPDVAPYHNRQVVVLGPQDWGRWLSPNIPATDVLGPAPAATLAVAQVR